MHDYFQTRAEIVLSVEKARISAAGGYIEYGRVNGKLRLSLPFVSSNIFSYE